MIRFFVGLFLFVVFAVSAAAVPGQVMKVETRCTSGTCSMVDGQLVTAGHLFGFYPDRLVVLQSSDPFQCESIESGEAEIGPGEIVAVDSGVRVVRPVQVVQSGAEVHWTPAPWLGSSGGIIRQRGKAVAVVRSRRGIFGQGWSVSKSKLKLR